MSARTFYVAASSSEVEFAAACMRDMEALGLKNSMDWTKCIGAPDAEWPALARRDIDAARDSDVFVLLASKPFGSSGLLVELGARLSAGKPVHLVGNRWHFFMAHPLVVWHSDWRAFLECAEGVSS